jgi:hypothetical protein
MVIINVVMLTVLYAESRVFNVILLNVVILTVVALIEINNAFFGHFITRKLKKHFSNFTISKQVFFLNH